MPGASGGILFYALVVDQDDNYSSSEVAEMRVLLADDHPEVRSALRLILEQEPNLTVVAEADAANGLLSQLRSVDPDLVLMDWELPGINPLDLLSALHSLSPDAMVIAISGRPEACCAALAAGANAFVSKGDPPERLLSAVRSLAAQSQGDSHDRSDHRSHVP